MNPIFQPSREAARRLLLAYRAAAEMRGDGARVSRGSLDIRRMMGLTSVQRSQAHCDELFRVAQIYAAQEIRHLDRS